MFSPAYLPIAFSFLRTPVIKWGLSMPAGFQEEGKEEKGVFSASLLLLSA